MMAVLHYQTSHWLSHRIPPGFAKWCLCIAITGVTNYFPPEIKGSDPNMRPLSACNKMIIEFDDRPPSPPLQLHSPIHANCQFLVMDYSGITYIYHFLHDRLCVEYDRRKKRW